MIPFIWWLVTARENENFLFWVGLKKVRGSWKLINICIAIFFGLTVITQLYIAPNLMPKGVTTQSQYAGSGYSAIIPVFFFSMIQTGLGEEILFRGFLGKRLCARLGFSVGNLLQAALFGILHGVLFFGVISIIRSQTDLEMSLINSIIVAIVISLFSGLGGWILGYLTEKASGGSIIPAWLVHGGGNFLLAMAYAVNLL